jgi:hypothetical protein
VNLKTKGTFAYSFAQEIMRSRWKGGDMALMAVTAHFDLNNSSKGGLL